MRRRLGLTIEDLSRKSRVSHNVIARLERDEAPGQPWVLGRILPLLASRFKETFPELAGDPYDFCIPPTSFGTWLRNQRLRRALKVRSFTVIRYEADLSKPTKAILRRLLLLLKLDPANHSLTNFGIPLS